MTIETTDHRLGSILARYVRDRENGTVGLILIPFSETGTVIARRGHVAGVEVDAYAKSLGCRLPAWHVDSLVQVKAAEDDGPAAFSQGRTMRNSTTVGQLRFAHQSKHREGDRSIIRTTLRHTSGWLAHHDLIWKSKARWLESRTTVENLSHDRVTLEMISSFSLSGISPFARDDAPGRMRVHRFRSVWSMEGRLETRTLEELHLERPWHDYGVRSERFGVAGSMPCNGFFPCAAVEDTEAGVVWGAQIAHTASWQIEFYRRDDTLSFSGGLADAEFGHWTKRLEPGESFQTPAVFLACVKGNLDDCCAAMVAAQEPPLKKQPQIERSLPVVFNEWCTTWGRPSEGNMVKLAASLRGLGIRFLVMDAGWYAPPDGAWNTAHGDWTPSSEFYPHGLKSTADAIRKEGLLPGLWFEMETCGRTSHAFHRHELLIHRSGRPLTLGDRRFFDFRKPEAIEHWKKGVLDLLHRAGFAYLKVDYNETTGIGFDGAESPGEAQRQHAEAALALFAKLRKELPELVIENCSSGGSRLVPPFFALTSMSSFSDAHECRELPIIAANLHRLMLPRQTQIWVVIRSEEDRQRSIYSLAAGFLGRICLSGDALDWTPGQRRLVRKALSLYKRVVPIIRKGTSLRLGPESPSMRHPSGWQCLLRAGSNGHLLAVAHVFANPDTREILVPLPPGRWTIAGRLSSLTATIRGHSLRLGGITPFSAGVFHIMPTPSATQTPCPHSTTP